MAGAEEYVGVGLVVVMMVSPDALVMMGDGVARQRDWLAFRRTPSRKFQVPTPAKIGAPFFLQPRSSPRGAP